MSRALVVGLARSGRAAALLLARTGWDVVAIDAGDVAVDDLLAAGVDARTGTADPVTDVDLVVKSPGVPEGAPPVVAARAAGIPVISEVELAARHTDCPIIAVTGTNGKTTTTELTAHLLRESGIPAIACGNQGTPVSGLVETTPHATVLVVECSSFQLEGVADAFHPVAAVLLNVTPDHLDRHGDMEAYAAAKLRVFANLAADDLAVAPAGTAIPGAAPARSVDETPVDGSIAWAEGGLHHADLGLVAHWDDVALRGRHNRQNAMAAVALAAHMGAGAAALAAGLASFPGVEHRLEVVAEVDGVTYVNDSKATNPDAAMAALDAYPARVHLIAGGRGKGTPFAPLADRAAGGVVAAYLVGEAAPELAAAFDAVGIPVVTSGTIDAAIAAARTAASSGDVVLLAPACTSLDQFSDYEARGRAFRDAVTGGRAGAVTPEP